MVTLEEAERIATASGLSTSEVTVERIASNGDRELYLGRSPAGACRFYNEQTRKCGIYAMRPADCRLFPLDLDRRRKRLHWIKYDVCPLAEKITTDDLRHAEVEILPAMGDTVDPYANAELSLYDRKDWTDLGPVAAFTGAR